MNYQIKQLNFCELYENHKIAEFNLQDVIPWDFGTPWLTVVNNDGDSFNRINKTKEMLDRDGNFHLCAILLNKGASVFYLYNLHGLARIDIPLASNQDLILNLHPNVVEKNYLAWILLCLGKRQCDGKPEDQYSIDLDKNSPIPIPVDLSGNPDLLMQQNIAREFVQIGYEILRSHFSDDNDRFLHWVNQRDELIQSIFQPE